MHFLACSKSPRWRCDFGAGSDFAVLGNASGCQIYNWEYIDTDGFAFLDPLPGRFHQVEFLLMDESTLLAFREHWICEDKAAPPESTIPEPRRGDAPR